MSDQDKQNNNSSKKEEEKSEIGEEEKNPEKPPQQKLDVGLYSKKLESFVQRIDLIIQEVSTTMYTSNPGLNANLENGIEKLIESKFWLINLRTIVNSQPPKEEDKAVITKAN